MGAEGNNAAPSHRPADDRLWQWGLHEDTMLFQRGNLFLLAQSLLVVAYSTILSAESGPSQSALVAARVIAVFGLPLTGVWLYAGHRHLRYSRALQDRAAPTSGLRRDPGGMPSAWRWRHLAHCVRPSIPRRRHVADTPIGQLGRVSGRDQSDCPRHRRHAGGGGRRGRTLLVSYVAP